MSSTSETDTVLDGDALGETAEGSSPDELSIGASGLRRGSMLGRYVVLDRLGAGGMGVVVSAYDPELDRKVAIKLLRGGAGSKADPRSQRLLREAKSLARLVHPNVISVYDVGAIEDSVFVAMEYVEGETLGSRMEGWQRDESSWEQILPVFLAAGKGLVAAHEKNIVHRDFKPANAMIAADGRVLVLDFGLALGVEHDQESGDDDPISLSASDPRLTRTGTILGTPAYMAPEQMARRTVGPAADQYSFCVALHQALYGQRPFRSESVRELVDKVLTGEIEAPRSSRGVPGWLHKVILRGLSRDPQDRFPSMSALLVAMETDPAKRLRTVALATAAVAGATGLVFAGSNLRESAPCKSASAPVSDVWNAAVGAAVKERFETVEGPFGREVADRVVPRLDAYAERWARGRREACEATRVRAEASEMVLLSRGLCYDRSLAALRGRVDAFNLADVKAVRAAPASIDSLPHLDECESSVVSIQRVEVLSDPTLRAEVRRIQAKLEETQARIGAGDHEGLVELIRQTGSEAEALGVKSVSAFAHAQHAVLLTILGKEPELRQALARRAVLEAEASGDDPTLLRVLRLQVSVVERGQGAGARQQTEQALDRLEAVIERNGNSPEALRSLSSARGSMALHYDRLEDTEAALRQVFALTEEHDLPIRAREVADLNRLATVLMRTNRVEEAEAAAHRALIHGARVLGPKHPTSVLTEVSLGRLKYLSGDYDEALASFQRAEDVMNARFPEGHSNVASIKNSAGLVLISAKRFDEARDAFESALEMAVREGGADDIIVGKLRGNLSTALAGLGRHEAAFVEQKEALRISRLMGGDGSTSAFYAAMDLGAQLRRLERFEEAGKLYAEASQWRLEHVGADDPLRCEAVHGLGLVALKEGDTASALEFMTEAASLLTEKVEPFVRGRVRHGLAQVRWELGEKAEARRLAKAAIKEYESGPVSSQDDLEDVVEWLAAHPE